MERHERALAIALAKLRWGPAKFRVLWYLCGNDSGADLGTILSQVPTSQETGMSPNTVRSALRELSDVDRVLICFEGAGSRGHAYAINWKFEEWCVPWYGVHPFAKEYAFRRQAALGHLNAVLHPQTDKKPGFVARPGARQSPIVARSVASLFGDRRADRRATTEAVSARPGARQFSADRAGDTIPSELRDSVSLAREGVDQLAGLIGARLHPPRPVIGDRLDALAKAAEGADVAEVAEIINSAPDDLRSIDGYIALVRQQTASKRIAAAPPAPRPEPPPPPALPERPPPDVFERGLSGAFAALRGSSRFDNGPDDDAAECETASGMGGN